MNSTQALALGCICLLLGLGCRPTEWRYQELQWEDGCRYMVLQHKILGDDPERTPSTIQSNTCYTAADLIEEMTGCGWEYVDSNPIQGGTRLIFKTSKKREGYWTAYPVHAFP